MDKARIREDMARRAQAWGVPSSGPESMADGGPTGVGSSQSLVLLPSGVSGMGGGSGGVVERTSTSIERPTTGGGMEGPLPAEVRAIIHTSCNGDAAEQAEVYARRLLSTHRRVRVYREELASAVEEVEDIKQVSRKNQLVCDALKQEIAGIDAKIQMLLNERQMCQVQLETEAKSLSRNEGKREEAERRVEVLRSTIDNITRETQRGHMLLRQLVPNLQIDNYCS